MYSYVVPRKGTDYEQVEIVARRIVDDMDALGYKRCCFRSDNAPALTSFLSMVKASWLTCDVVVPETSPKGDSQSNGAAENGVRLAKAMVRTIKDALEWRLGAEIPDDHPLLTWISRYGSIACRRFAIGGDGRTPWERLTGRRHRGFSA